MQTQVNSAADNSAAQGSPLMKKPTMVSTDTHGGKSPSNRKPGGKTDGKRDSTRKSQQSTPSNKSKMRLRSIGSRTGARGSIMDNTGDPKSGQASEKKFMTKKERLAKKEEEKRLRLLQEQESAKTGILFTETMRKYKRQQRTIKRRNSASKRLQIPTLQGKLIDPFVSDSEESKENPMPVFDKLAKSEAVRKQTRVEWRAQHREI
jgi:hypothetical protein